MKQTNKNTYTDNGRIKEECGVFGIFNPHGEDAASTIYYGLSSLQHRGQESAGLPCLTPAGQKEIWKQKGAWGLSMKYLKKKH